MNRRGESEDAKKGRCGTTGKRCVATLSVIAAALLVLAISTPAAALGLYFERLKNPDVVECPYCHKPIVTGGIHENAERTLMTEFGGILSEKDIVYTREEGQTRYLHVFVYRYQERQGGNFSINRPASAGFHTHLFEGKALLKTIVFDETQQALSENVLRLPTFIRRGGKWITVGELSREGVQKAIDAFGEVLAEGDNREKK